MSEWEGFGDEKSSPLRGLLTVFSIFFPIALLIAGFGFLYLTQKNFKEDYSGQGLEVGSEFVYPSEVLKDKRGYMGKELTIRGETALATTTCSRTECPESDPCCGCPDERNLILIDRGGKLLKQTGGILKLLASGERPFCQRVIGSCDYECPGWEVGVVYDVQGTFYAEPPPPGSSSNLFLDFYFEVLGQKAVEGTSFSERADRITSAVRGLIERLFGSADFYVLQD
jgi:hypothetical protein